MGTERILRWHANRRGEQEMTIPALFLLLISSLAMADDGYIDLPFTSVQANSCPANQFAYGIQTTGTLSCMTISGSALPNPSASTLGGVESYAAVANQWINAISTSGIPSSTQPACGNLSNAAPSCSTDTTNASNITTGTLGSTVQGNITTTGTVTSGTWNGTAVGSQYGGTGINSSASTGMPSLSSGTWSISSLATTFVSLFETVATTAGDLIYGGSSGTPTRLAIGTATQDLRVSSSGSPVWTDLIDASHVVMIYDDFLLGDQELSGYWAVSSSGSGSAVATYTGGTSANPGLISLYTGTATTGSAELYSDTRNALFFVGAGAITYETNVGLSAISTSLQNYTVYIGMTTNELPDASPTNGIYFTTNYNTDSGDWVLNCTSGGTTTSEDTGVVAGTSFTKLGFTVNAAGTSVQAYVGGASKGSPCTANIPTAGVNFEWGIVKSAGTTAVFMLVDYIKFIDVLTTAR